MTRRKQTTASALPQGGAEGQSPPSPELFESMENVRARAMTFLFKGRIPRSRLSLLEGDKGVGKSTMLAAIAASVTGGPPLPGHRRSKEGAGVLWLASEEDYESEVKPRLVSAEAVIARVYNPAVDRRSGLRHRLQLPADLHRLNEVVDRHNVELFIADPWVSLMPPFLSVKDEQAVRSVLEPLGDWCSLLGVTTILTRHLSKNRSAPLLDQGLGSVAVGNVARSILRLSPHPVEVGVCCLSHVNINGSVRAPTLTYRFLAEGQKPPKICWSGEISLTADQIAEEREEPAERDAFDDAKRLLRGLLNGEARPCKEVMLEMRDAGISERTLRKAKVALRVTSRRVKAGMRAYWEWAEPKGGFEKE
jgi:archaellum biogenesis ATPase FlaH